MKLKQFISVLVLLSLIPLVHGLTVDQLVESYSYDFYNGSINITTYIDGLLDLDTNNENDTLQFNLTIVPFVTGEYKTYLNILDNTSIVVINDSRTFSTTTTISLNANTTSLTGNRWNYTVEIYDVNDNLVFRKYKRETSQYANYKNGTRIISFGDSNLNNAIINVTVRFNVTTNETVNITGYLFANATNKTITAVTEAALVVGEQNVSLLFDNESIKSTHQNGTFTLDKVALGARIIDTEYNTSSYNYENFALTSYMRNIVGGYVDNQTNNLSDYLQLNISANIKSAETYTIDGALYDELNTYIINFSQQFPSLGVANHTLVINVNGSQIYQTYTDGPYVLQYINLMNSTGDVIDSLSNAHTTNTTDYTDFERPKLPDLNITLNVTFYPETNITNISINVSNIGSAPASNIFMDLFDNSTYAVNDSVAFLDIGQIKEFNYSIPNSTNLTVYITVVDLNGVVDELNESNNIDVWPPINPPPQFSNSTYIPATPIFNTTVSFNITITEDVNGSYYTFSYNNGSGFVNDTPVAWTGNFTRVEINKTLSGKQGTVVQWIWYANDTQNATGISDTYNFAIANTNATIETPVFNVTTVTETSGIKANTTYRDIDNANGSVFFTWYRNGSIISSENFTNIAPTTIVNSTLSNTVYAKGDQINVTVIANDTVENTTVNFSTTLTVANTVPTHATPILNTSTGNNRTTDNLTIYNISTYDADSDTSKNIINWRRNGTSVLLLNVPMEGGSTVNTARDYSDFNNTINVWNATWFKSVGYDGFGAYNFSVGNNTFMNISYNQIFNTSTWTVEAYVYPHTSYATGGVFVGKWKTSPEQDQWQLAYVSGNKFRCGANNFTAFQAITSAAVSPKNWYHVICTYNGTDIVLYVNGTLQNSSTINTIRNNDAEIQIGARRTDLFFNGTIDDVRIWNTTLSWQQINNSFLNRTNQMHSSMLLEGQTWNATLTPNDHDADGDTKVSNSVIIRLSPMHDPPILNATTTSNFTIDNLTVYNISTFDLEGDAIKNIISWYRNNTPLMIFSSPAEGGSTVLSTRDYSGRNLSINVVNASWSNSSGYDGFGAYNFSKNNPNNKTFLNVSYNTAFNVTSWTIMAWVYPHSTDPAGGVAVGKFQQWQLSYLFNNKYRCGTNNVSGIFIPVNSRSSAAFVKKWSHVACVFNGTNLSIYVNGNLENWTNVEGGGLQSDINELQVGARRADQLFNGSVDDVQIWNGTLTWEQINASFNNRTTQIHYTMTMANETWNASITPNDKGRDGQTLFSSSVAIQKVPITLIIGAGGDILNSTTYRVTESILEQPVERLNSTNYTTTVGMESIIG